MNCDEQDLVTARTKIDALDLEPVVKRMMYVHYWPRKHALAASAQYRNYLYLCKKYIGKFSLPPSYEIDELWHNHILCTRKYHREINDIFGLFLHHDPHHENDGALAHEKLLNTFEENTQRLYKQEFGDYLMNTRPNFVLKFVQRVKYKFKNPYKTKQLMKESV